MKAITKEIKKEKTARQRANQKKRLRQMESGKITNRIERAWQDEQFRLYVERSEKRRKEAKSPKPKSPHISSPRPFPSDSTLKYIAPWF